MVLVRRNALLLLAATLPILQSVCSSSQLWTQRTGSQKEHPTMHQQQGAQIQSSADSTGDNLFGFCSLPARHSKHETLQGSMSTHIQKSLNLRGGKQRAGYEPRATGGAAVTNAGGQARGAPSTNRRTVKPTKQKNSANGPKLGYSAKDFAALSKEVTQQVEGKVKEQMAKESRDEEEVRRRSRNKNKKQLRKRQVFCSLPIAMNFGLCFVCVCERLCVPLILCLTCTVHPKLDARIHHTLPSLNPYLDLQGSYVPSIKNRMRNIERTLQRKGHMMPDEVF